MNCRKEYGPSQPFKGLNINGLLHMTIQTGVLMETLAAQLEGVPDEAGNGQKRVGLGESVGPSPFEPTIDEGKGERGETRGGKG